MSGGGLGLRVRRALRACARGLVAAGLSQAACIPLFVAAVVSIALIPVGIGLLLTPATLGAVRGLANRQRRWAREWSGVAIAIPYRTERHPVGGGRGGRLRACRWLLSDPATWRDLLWTLVNAPVGLVLGLLPAGLLVNGVFGVLVAPWVWAFAGSDSPYWPLSVPIGAAALLVLAYGGPQIFRAHAVFSASLLAPSRTQLAARLGRLSESRSQVLDASATELRRIERDLHDGA